MTFFTFAALVNPVLFCVFVFFAQRKWTDSAQKQKTLNIIMISDLSVLKVKIILKQKLTDVIYFLNTYSFIISLPLKLSNGKLTLTNSSEVQTRAKAIINHRNWNRTTKSTFTRQKTNTDFTTEKKRRQDLLFFIQLFPTRGASIWCLIWWPALNNVFYCQPKSWVCGAAVGTLASKCKTKKMQNAISKISCWRWQQSYNDHRIQQHGQRWHSGPQTSTEEQGGRTEGCFSHISCEIYSYILSQVDSSLVRRRGGRLLSEYPA